MKKKFAAIGWVALYLGIYFAVSFLIVFAIITVPVMTAVSQGMMGNMTLFEKFMKGFSNLMTRPDVMVLLNGCMQLVFLACFGLWYYFRERRYHDRPRYREVFRVKGTLRLIGLGFFGQYVVVPILMLIYVAMPKAMDEYGKLAENFDLDVLPAPIMIFMIGILGPIMEEMLFRGMIYGKLRRAFSAWPAIVMSALLFGVFHMNLVQGIYASVLGIALGFVREKTGTVWGSVVVHMVFNLCSYLMEFLTGFLENCGLDKIELLGISVSMMLELGLLFGSFIGFFLLLFSYRQKPVYKQP